MSKLTDHYQDTGPGWAAILTMLHAELQKICPDYEVSQVKEKFGGLRAYLRLPHSEGLNPDEETMRSACYALEHKYEALSYSVCEVCGRAGTNEARRSGWYKTLCPDHKGVNGSMSG